jgi:hypothetical protein
LVAATPLQHQPPDQRAPQASRATRDRQDNRARLANPEIRASLVMRDVRATQAARAIRAVTVIRAEPEIRGVQATKGEKARTHHVQRDSIAIQTLRRERRVAFRTTDLTGNNFNGPKAPRTISGASTRYPEAAIRCPAAE